MSEDPPPADQPGPEPVDVRCAQCDQIVPAGAPTCPACGKLAAVPVVTKTPVIVGVLGGFGLGMVLAIVLVTCALSSANLITTPATHALGGAIIILTAIILPAAIFLIGLRLATRGKPALGAFLMVGVALGSGLATPCTIPTVFAVFTQY
jgi:hypothetical protein